MTSSSTFLATDGAAYEQLMGRWSRRLADPFLDFVGAAPGERVLDVGCGTGALGSALVRQVPVSAVYGVDLSPAYIAHAQATQPDPKIRFEVGDACALGFADGSFDRGCRCCCCTSCRARVRRLRR